MGFNYFSAELDPRGGAHVVSGRGEIDVYSAPELRDALNEAVSRGPNPVVVNLSDVTFMESRGLHLLLNAQRRLTRQRRDLAVVCPPDGPVRRVFELTRLDTTFSLHESLDAAIAATLARSA